MRSVAAVCCAAVFLPAGLANARPDAMSTLHVTVKGSLSQATFLVRADSPGRTVVSVGTDRTNMISRTDASVKTLHTVKVTPLAPATRYYFAVQVTDTKGRKVRKTGQFLTGSVRPATMSISDGRFRLNGVPFFPIMALGYTNCPAPDVVAESVQMGINVINRRYYPLCSRNKQTYEITTAELHEILNRRVWWLDEVTFGKFADLPEHLNLSQDFYLYIQAGDLWGCSTRDSSAAGLYARMKSMVEQRGRDGQPVVQFFAIVEKTVNNLHPLCGNARRFTAQFWTTIVAGAAGIEYDQEHVARLEEGIAVAPAVKAQARIEADRLKTLYPAIVGGTTRPSATNSGAIKLRAWTYGGREYVVAVNVENRAARAELRFPASNAATAVVMWEERHRAVVRGAFVESFKPHEVHIYELR